MTSCSHSDDVAVYCDLPSRQQCCHLALPAAAVAGGSAGGSSANQHQPAVLHAGRPYRFFATVVDLRLVNGSSSMDGRLEVKLDNGTWGTVCDDSFDDAAASVACRMLSFGPGRSFPNAFFGPGTLID